MRIGFYFGVFALLMTSCTGRVYVINRTSSIPPANYEHSFAILQKETSNTAEKHLEKLVRKTLLRSKWRYDNESPDYIISVSQDSEMIHINLLEAGTFICKWQGKVFTPQKELSELQLNRVVLAALR